MPVADAPGTAAVVVPGTGAAFAAALGTAATRRAVVVGSRDASALARYVIRAALALPPRPPISPGSVAAASNASAEMPPAPGRDIAGRRAAAERRISENAVDSRRMSTQLRSRSGRRWNNSRELRVGFPLRASERSNDACHTSAQARSRAVSINCLL